MKELCFIGGDLRQVRVINQMSKEEYKIKVYGFDLLDKKEIDEKVQRCDNLEAALKSADAVVLPLPYTLGRETVNAPYCKTEIHTGDILRNLSEKQLLLLGKGDEGLNAIAKLYGIRIIDYFERDELAILNSIPTAEGAVEIAMRETPITLNGSKCLILGNGRIGKILTKMLMGIGADVTVCVRKHKDGAYCKAFGVKSMFFARLSEDIEKYDIVFNTVPTQVVGYKVLKNVGADCVIIDLASKPGGVDFETAKSLGVKVIWALSLPGKVAPHTAGDFISETILNILEELGV